MVLEALGDAQAKFEAGDAKEKRSAIAITLAAVDWLAECHGIGANGRRLLGQMLGYLADIDAGRACPILEPAGAGWSGIRSQQQLVLGTIAGLIDGLKDGGASVRDATATAKRWAQAAGHKIDGSIADFRKRASSKGELAVTARAAAREAIRGRSTGEAEGIAIYLLRRALPDGANGALD